MGTTGMPTIEILRGQEKLGPFTVEETQKHLANGSLQPSEMAWCTGMTEWATLTEVLDKLTQNRSTQGANHNSQPNNHVSPRQFRQLLETSANEIRRVLNE
jgi:hypothetical protein